MAVDRNTPFAAQFVRSLAQAGLENVCISPGSRSTPLVLAFSVHPGVKTWVLIDERSTAYFALGLALATNKPVGILTTSGTAVANLLPAIIEARQSSVPLVIITADRPHELRQSGANQSIDQVKIFGSAVKWFADLPLPEETPSPLLHRYLESLAGSAYSKAMEGLPGPVHLNLPFRKPLEPVSDSTLDAPTSVDTRQEAHAAIRPLARVSGGETISAVALGSVGDLIRRHARGLIILGPRSFADEYQAELSNLATLSGYPVLADPLSGARFSGNAERDVVLCGGYDWYIQGSGQADLILSIGSQPTSSGLEKYLAGLDGAVRISIQPGGRWLDPSHQTQISVEAQPDAAVAALAEVLAEKPPEDSARRTWRDRFKIAELQVNTVLDERIDRDYCEGMAARDLVATLTPGSLVFAANSLSIRHIDRYATRSNGALHIFANRGASGIDGNISTAAGLAAGFGRPITLLIGDLAFHHDQTGLLAFQKYAPGSRIVLINNHGGGIFQQLPVASFEPQFEEYFRTPVDLDYASLTAAYGGHYSSASYRSEFLELLGASVDPGGFQVIEFISQIERHEKNRVEITNLIKERMKS